MSEGPLISIITPFLNRRAFLEEAVESVFSQTYENWELLLVDDGSTDDSIDIALRYAEKYPDKVRYLMHEGHANRGSSASRNLGRRHARGTWIAYLDSDDIWLPRKLEQQVAIMEAHPEVDLIIGATEYWYSWTGQPEDQLRDTIILVGGPQNAMVPPPQLLEILYPLGSGRAPCPTAALVRSDLIDRVGGWEEQFQVGYDDQVFLVKMYLSGLVFISATNWARYRQHSTSSMNTVLSGASYDLNRRRFLEWLEAYLAERKLQHTPAWQLLQKALWRSRHPSLSRAGRFVRHPLAALKRVGRLGLTVFRR